MRFLRLVPFFFLLPVAVAQAPAAKPPAKDSAVIEQYLTRVEMQNDGTGGAETTVRVTVKTPAGVKDYGLLAFSYPRANASLDLLYVRVRKPDGTVVETPVDTAQDVEAELSRVAPTYSDLREKHIAVRGLAPGDVLEYSSRQTTTRPLVPGQFWYFYNSGSQVLVRDEELTVSVPAGRPVLVRHGDVPPTQRLESGRKIYAWKWQNLEPKEHKTDDYAWVQSVLVGRQPAVEVQITSFRSWDEIAKWYATLVADRVVPSPEIQARVAQLTRGLASDDQKIQAIYDFVSTQFRYINVSFGIGRYQPHAAAEVYSYGYGDCKDKHTLLATMLKAAGIEAYPALINSRQEIDEQLPSPGQFDHMITYVPRPGAAPLWLDTTAEVAPAGALVSTLRGKPALVMRPNGTATLERTPLSFPFREHDVFEGQGTLDSDGKFHGKIDWERHGDTELVLRSALRSLPPARWDEVLQQVSYLSGFGGKISESTVSSLENIEQSLKVSYSYEREDYGGWSRGDTSPFLPRLRYPDLPDPSDAGVKKFDVYLGAVGDVVLHSKMKLPLGSDPEMPPATVNVEQPFAEYHATYAYKDGVLETTRTVVIKQSVVPAAQYSALRDFFRAIGDDQDRAIPLHASLNPLRPKSSTVPEAQAAFERGMREAMAGRFQDAIADARRALELDPKIEGAWSVVGMSEFALKHTEDALAAYRKEVELHPDWATGYNQLAGTLMQLKRYDEAIAVGRQWQSAIPDDRQPLIGIADALFATKKYKESQAEFRAALDKSANAPAAARSFLYYRYGMVSLRAGDKDAALPAFKRSIELNEDAETLNGAAWELADANLELDVALPWSREAVRLAERRTHGIDLDNLQPADVRAIDSLGNLWDTLGWIYYRQGKLADAEDLLKPAWDLTQRKEIGEHLVQVYARRNQIALAARARNDLRHSAQPETFQLPRLVRGKNWSAEVFLLLGPDGKNGAKVEGVHYLDRAKELPALTRALKAADFHASLPPGSDARLLRKGIVYCGTYVGCTITLLVPADVQGVE